MSLTARFSESMMAVETAGTATKPRRKRDAPFAIRLSKDERAQLEQDAAGAPLGAYIKAKVFSEALPVRMRRTGLAVEDRQLLAKILAMLGASCLSSNLSELACLASIGALAFTPETESELRATLCDVRDMRRHLMLALGIKPEKAAR